MASLSQAALSSFRALSFLLVSCLYRGALAGVLFFFKDWGGVWSGGGGQRALSSGLGSLGGGGHKPWPPDPQEEGA